MSFSTSYRPPPPAPSAYFAMQHATSSTAAMASQVSTPGTYLPRIPSKLSLHISQGQTVPIHGSQVATQTAPASRNNSASSITALPSLSSSLNNLHAATNIEHLEVVGTRTAEADELVSPMSPPATYRPGQSDHQTVTACNSRQRQTTFKSIHCASAIACG
jgi:hypothetical protein